MGNLASVNLDEYKAYFGLCILIIIFIKQPSVSFFVGLILKVLRINYSELEYKNYDEKLFNQQLFRLKRGVRTRTPEDALLISKALDNGEINRSMLRFTSFFGDVGVKRTIMLEFIFAIICGLLLMGSAYTLVYNLPYMRSGYALYNADDGSKLYISKHQIYDRKSNKSYNKMDCTDISLSRNKKSPLDKACLYITTKDLDMRSELNDAIESGKNVKLFLSSLVVICFGLGWVLIVGYNNYRNLNKIVCDLKGI